MHDLNLAAIYHMPWLEYRHALPDGRACLRLRTARGNFDRAAARVTCNYWGDDPFAKGLDLPMELAFRDDLYDYYQVAYRPEDPRVKYVFYLYQGETTVLFDCQGPHIGGTLYPDVEEAFVFAYVYPPDPMPEWARGCVGYQIFPDRFRRAGEPEEGLEPWTSERYENERRFGGNLRGVREAVPYLHDLGVDFIYTCPIFRSDTAHRYNTFDYYQVDPLLGTEADLKALCDELHRHGMRLVLDGVFNHSGVGFAPFRDAVEKGKASEYYDWFFFDDSVPFGYRTFAFAEYMPKLNLRNEACAEYFLKVGEYWLREVGVDGWRLDVSPEVYPDFWRRFHAMMKRVKPDSIMVAECWDDSREWLTVGDQFDATMHYVLSRCIWGRFADHKLSLAEFDARINRAAMLYPHRTQEVLWNFLGSHDTPRFLTRAGGDPAMLRAASFFQLTQPGVPVIYYGDELGMEGKGDPDCRRPMRWDDVEGNAMRAHYQRLTALRHAHPSLRVGELRTHCVLKDDLYAYLRITDTERALVVLNATTEPQHEYLPLPEALRGRKSLTDAYTGRRLRVVGEQLECGLDTGEGLLVFY